METELTFNGGIIFVNELALNKLYCQAGFAHTASTDYDEFVFSEKLFLIIIDVG